MCRKVSDGVEQRERVWANFERYCLSGQLPGGAESRGELKGLFNAARRRQGESVLRRPDDDRDQGGADPR